MKEKVNKELEEVFEEFEDQFFEAVSVLKAEVYKIVGRGSVGAKEETSES